MSVEGATVPRGEATSYYGRPVLKAPVWKPEVPIYFFTGGIAGASAGLALAARLRGNDEPVSYTHLTLPTICSV